MISLAEERQDQEAKRRKTDRSRTVDVSIAASATMTGPSPNLQLTTAPSAPPIHPSLPQKPQIDFATAADSMGLSGASSQSSTQHATAAAKALGGSNHDIVANRGAIRMANMSAAEALKAEMAALQPVKASTKASLPPKPVSSIQLPETPSSAITSSLPSNPSISSIPTDVPAVSVRSDPESDVPGLSFPTPVPVDLTPSDGSVVMPDDGPILYTMPSDGDVSTNATAEKASIGDASMDGVEINPDPSKTVVADPEAHGTKRKLDESLSGGDEADESTITPEEDDAPADAETAGLTLKVNPDGTVEQEDHVRRVVPILPKVLMIILASGYGSLDIRSGITGKNLA
jgi:5'-3' exoribonuclease 2